MVTKLHDTVHKLKSNILYYCNQEIVLQEVPNEISLALSMSGCPLKCKGCHSSFTWKDTLGKILTNEELNALIDKNEHISCVLFYGGEWKAKRLIELLQIAKNRNLKTCLYTGYELDDISDEMKNRLDYLKVGRYIETLGGLDNKNTNQRFFDLKNNKDLTHLFCAGS